MKSSRVTPRPVLPPQPCRPGPAGDGHRDVGREPDCSGQDRRRALSHLRNPWLGWPFQFAGTDSRPQPRPARWNRSSRSRHSRHPPAEPARPGRDLPAKPATAIDLRCTRMYLAPISRGPAPPPGAWHGRDHAIAGSASDSACWKQ